MMNVCEARIRFQLPREIFGYTANAILSSNPIEELMTGADGVKHALTRLANAEFYYHDV